MDPAHSVMQAVLASRGSGWLRLDNGNVLTPHGSLSVETAPGSGVLQPAWQARAQISSNVPSLWLQGDTTQFIASALASRPLIGLAPIRPRGAFELALFRDRHYVFGLRDLKLDVTSRDLVRTRAESQA